MFIICYDGVLNQYLVGILDHSELHISGAGESKRLGVRQMHDGYFIDRILLITQEWTGRSRDRNRCREREVDSHGSHYVRKIPQPEAIDLFFKVLLD